MNGSLAKICSDWKTGFSELGVYYLIMFVTLNVSDIVCRLTTEINKAV